MQQQRELQVGIYKGNNKKPAGAKDTSSAVHNSNKNARWKPARREGEKCGQRCNLAGERKMYLRRPRGEWALQPWEISLRVRGMRARAHASLCIHYAWFFLPSVIKLPIIESSRKKSSRVLSNKQGEIITSSMRKERKKAHCVSPGRGLDVGGVTPRVKVPRAGRQKQRWKRALMMIKKYIKKGPEGKKNKWTFLSLSFLHPSPASLREGIRVLDP